MKKIILTFLTISLLGLAVPTAFAQNTQADATARSSFRNRVSEISARLVSKIDNRVTKYEEFQVKIQRKRAAIAQEGKDTTELDRLIRVAESSLTTTKADVTDLKAAINSIDYTQSNREVVRVFQNEIRDIRQSFRTLHQAMADVVTEIRSLSK